MSRQITYDGTGAFQVRFPFDRRLVDLVKTLPNRRWNAPEKYWWVPEADVVPMVDLLRAERFTLDEATRSLYLERGGQGPMDSGGEGRDEAERATDGDFTVARLNQEVAAVLQAAFPLPIWLVGEIAGFNKSAHKRHVGFTLVERDRDGCQLAQVQTILFEDVRREIEGRLVAAGSPFRLEDEIAIRIRARVEVYADWGQYRVRVEDLDIGFTLGEAARRREEILRLLSQEGILERNRSLVLPLLPLRVGLVTSLGSDAERDVLETLRESRFAFAVTVHGARVQGRATEPSVLNALDWFRQRADDFDVVLLCRGGGSRTDLAWFDSEALGRAVALFPIPVVVGIGHEQDRSVLDEVGWRCKTPTAAAAFLVDRVASALEGVEAMGATLFEAASNRLTGAERDHAVRAQRLSRAAGALLARERLRLDHGAGLLLRSMRAHLRVAGREVARGAAALPLAAVRLIEGRRVEMEGVIRQVVQGSRRDLGSAGRMVCEMATALGPASLRSIGLETERVSARERRLALADPRRVVERGYSIMRLPSGTVLTRAVAAPRGTILLAELREGRLRLRSEGEESGA